MFLYYDSRRPLSSNVHSSLLVCAESVIYLGRTWCCALQVHIIIKYDFILVQADDQVRASADINESYLQL